ncbi:MAG: hypothetical protein EOO03_07310 [Chitinophagaceae bacterium]|nr:MAG: hypothetical protein EOO03_07310 [Chitinophagaceae bacterium]
MKPTINFPGLLVAGLLAGIMLQSCDDGSAEPKQNKKDSAQTTSESKATVAVLDTADYDKRIMALANNDTTGKWPAKNAHPLPGAILPYNRVIAYYGNLYSKRMGILGEVAKDSMFKRLLAEVKSWQRADSAVKTIPALHYVAVTAQGAPGKDAKHRMRMPGHQIDTIISWAREINALAFVDVQVGHSIVKDELPPLEKWLAQPDVHLGIDPEFSMKKGEIPGTRIGTMDASDINDAIDFLAGVVKKNNLTPKILVVHRFTQGMITNYQNIKSVPEVQVVIDMDGFGDKILKRSTYLRYVYKEPVQFTGFKLFYKNDSKNTSGLYTPEELLKFIPKPIYIQYQ